MRSKKNFDLSMFVSLACLIITNIKQLNINRADNLESNRDIYLKVCFVVLDLIIYFHIFK